MRTIALCAAALATAILITPASAGGGNSIHPAGWFTMPDGTSYLTIAPYGVTDEAAISDYCKELTARGLAGERCVEESMVLLRQNCGGGNVCIAIETSETNIARFESIIVTPTREQVARTFEPPAPPVRPADEFLSGRTEESATQSASPAEPVEEPKEPAPTPPQTTETDLANTTPSSKPSIAQEKPAESEFNFGQLDSNPEPRAVNPPALIRPDLISRTHWRREIASMKFLGFYIPNWWPWAVGAIVLILVATFLYIRGHRRKSQGGIQPMAAKKAAEPKKNGEDGSGDEGSHTVEGKVGIFSVNLTIKPAIRKALALLTPSSWRLWRHKHVEKDRTEPVMSSSSHQEDEESENGTVPSEDADIDSTAGPRLPVPAESGNGTNVSAEAVSKPGNCVNQPRSATVVRPSITGRGNGSDPPRKKLVTGSVSTFDCMIPVKHSQYAGQPFHLDRVLMEKDAAKKLIDELPEKVRKERFPEDEWGLVESHVSPLCFFYRDPKLNGEPQFITRFGSSPTSDQMVRAWELRIERGVARAHKASERPSVINVR